MLFSHPAFLWGLLAVAIPIVVHLLNLRRYRKVYFSNVEHLRELHTEQRRQHTLHRWLILAMRVLAIIFLVLAFAQPVIPTSEETLRTDNTAVSLYIDNSFSMANSTADGSLLDAARQKGREIVEAYSVSDRFQLITNDMKGSEMRWLNRDEVLSALDEIEPSPAAPLMSTVATRQLDFLLHNSPAGGHSKGRSRHAYLISDFQRTTADVAELPSDSSMLYTLVPLNAVASDNLYIDSVVLDAPAYIEGGNVAVVIDLRNSGGHDAEKVPVRLTIDGRERAVATVDVAAGSTARTTLAFRIERKGWLDGCVSIEDYPVTFDDSYYFTLHVGDPIRVLHLDGGATNESLQRLFATDSIIDYQHATHLQHDLTQYDFVILNEPRGLTSGEVQQLTQWVADGGSLLAVPGRDEVTALNDLLRSLQAPRLERWVQRVVKAASVDYDNRLYREVFVGHDDEMEMPSVQGHYLFGRDQIVKQSIITLDDNSDLLCSAPTGNGQLYLFSTPLTGAQTDFVNQALFVPTLYNMALYSRPLPPIAHMLGSDEPILLQNTYDNATKPTAITDGQSLNILPDIRRVAGRHQLVLHDELTHDGIYTLADEHLAFNYPRRESQMDFWERQEIAKTIGGRDGLTMVLNSDKPLTEIIRERDSGRPLWRLCILLALLALATEVVLLKLNTKH